jgi:hypothetical protein
MKTSAFILVVAVAFSLLPSEGFSQKIFRSFESQNKINHIQATSGASVSRSSEFPALGAYSLKAVFPSKGGAIELDRFPVTDWARHDVLLLFVWAKQRAPIDLTIKGASNHAATKDYTLKEGINTIQLPLATLPHLDLKHVKSITIRAHQGLTAYFDYLSLDRSQPALANGGRWDIQYSDKVKTSHISWGKPLAGGPIKSYSISPVFDGRGIIELAERLGLSHKVTTIGRSAGRNLEGAKPLITKDGRPELLYHRYGAGAAFLLNYFLDQYPDEKMNRANGASLARFRKLLGKAKIKPAIRLRTSGDRPASGIAKLDFVSKNGAAKLVGLLPDKNRQAGNIVVHLNQPAHVYDIRNKKDLGDVSHFEIKAKPAVPELFGLTQGAIETIEVKAPSRAKLGTEVKVRLQLSGADSAKLDSVAHVDVFYPDGRKSAIYKNNCSISEGTGTFSFRPAINDPSGDWKIRITDVISGREKNVSINIHEAPLTISKCSKCRPA